MVSGGGGGFWCYLTRKSENKGGDGRKKAGLSFRPEQAQVRVKEAKSLMESQVRRGLLSLELSL